MAQSILKRGFKANAEKLAKAYREQLKVHPCAPLSAFKLAEHLNIPVYDILEFVTDFDQRKILVGRDGIDCEWSALTMTTARRNKIIIHNTYHSKRRQQSNVMHELAHIICNHEIKIIEPSVNFPIGMRTFDELQEEEAKCLGATLQLATPGLLWSRKQNMTHDEIAEYFDASVEMVKYRMNITGISRIKR